MQIWYFKDFLMIVPAWQKFLAKSGIMNSFSFHKLALGVKKSYPNCHLNIAIMLPETHYFED